MCLVVDERARHNAANGRLGFRRKKGDAWKQYTFMLGEPVTQALSSPQYNCISCCLASSRKSRVNHRRFIPRVFLDKSTIQLSKNKLSDAYVSTPPFFLLAICSCNPNYSAIESKLTVHCWNFYDLFPNIM